MKVWPAKEIDTKPPGLIAYCMTVVSYALGVLVAVVLSPFVNFFFYTNRFPDSDERQDIYDNLQSNASGVALSSVSGLVLAVVIMLCLKFGRYFALILTIIQQIVLSTSLNLFATWLMWKYNPTSNATILTMLPFFVTQMAVFVTLELGALFGQGGRVLYNFVALGAILGAFVGTSRSIQQDYFYFGGENPFENEVELGVAFGKSLLDTAFFVGSCGLSSACIARSKAGGSFLWHFLAFVLPVGLACAFSLYVELADYIPVISSTAARYTVGVLVALVSDALAFGAFYPTKKLASRSQGRPKTLFSPNTSAGGPIAANAVVVV